MAEGPECSVGEDAIVSPGLFAESEESEKDEGAENEEPSAQLDADIPSLRRFPNNGGNGVNVVVSVMDDVPVPRADEVLACVDEEVEC